MMNYSFDKIHFNMDDRAERYLNVFSNIEGQINISYVKSTNHIVAWHKHEKQTDYWVCVKGSFKVGLSQDEKTDFIYLTEKEALEPESIMLYYLSDKYDPEDEHRAKVGDFGESWNRENK